MSEKKKRDRTGLADPAAGEGKTRRAPSAGAASSSDASGAAGTPMDVRLLEQLVKLMAANDLNTVDLRDGDRRVVLKRGPAVSPVSYAPSMPGPQAAYAPASQPQAGAGASSGATTGTGPGAAPDESAGLVAVKAEMVGTFYSSPKPGEPSFVNVGSTVDEETSVCVIEAMKNFFPVKAGVRGTIAKVLVQNGQTVQFDQALFLVKPA